MMSNKRKRVDGEDNIQSKIANINVIHPLTASSVSIPTLSVVPGNIPDDSITNAQLQTITAAGKVENSATTASFANGANTIVARDATGIIQVSNLLSPAISNPGAAITVDATEIVATQTTLGINTIVASTSVEAPQVYATALQAPPGNDLSLVNNTDNYVRLTGGLGVIVDQDLSITNNAKLNTFGLELTNNSIASYVPTTLTHFEIYNMVTTATGPFAAPIAVTFTFMRLGGAAGAACLVSWTDCFNSNTTTAAPIAITATIPARFRPKAQARLISQGVNAGANLANPCTWDITTGGVIAGYRNFASGSTSWSIASSATGFYSGAGSYVVV
jgi:hypothetical protein